jgi:hypothetical protein
MSAYLVEFFLPRSKGDGAAAIAHRAQQASARLTAEGTPVRLAQAFTVPADDLYLCIFDAESADAVAEAVRRAHLPAAGQPESVQVIDLGSQHEGTTLREGE